MVLKNTYFKCSILEDFSTFIFFSKLNALCVTFKGIDWHEIE